MPLVAVVLVWLLVIRPLSRRRERQAKQRRGTLPRDPRQRTATKGEVIWRIGVLYWGGMMFLFFAIVGPLIPHFTMGKPLSPDEYIKGAIVALVAFPAGAVFGWRLWRPAEQNRRAG